MKPWADVSDLINPSHPFAEISIEISSHILYILTGEKFQGIHTATEYFGGPQQSYQIEPNLIDGKMYNLPSSGESKYGPSIVKDQKIYLRHRPVREVLEVVELGKVVDPTNYTLRDRHFIRRKNGQGWVANQMNELEVTYIYGALPPNAGIRAAIILANQLYLSEIDSDECALPTRITSIQRQGVSITALDPQDFLLEGRTGIYEVDLFIKTYNPNQAQKKSKIIVPGRIRGEKVT